MIDIGTATTRLLTALAEPRPEALEAAADRNETQARLADTQARRWMSMGDHEAASHYREKARQYRVAAEYERDRAMSLRAAGLAPWATR